MDLLFELMQEPKNIKLGKKQFEREHRIDNSTKTVYSQIQI